MSSFVLDASVAVKWWLTSADEQLLDEAFWILDEHRRGRIKLTGPDLLWPEVGNVLHRAVRRGRLTKRQAERSIDEFLEAGVVAESSEPLLRTAFVIASVENQPVYDAIYVALALSLNEPLLTADQRLFDALGSQYPIKWLGAVI